MTRCIGLLFLVFAGFNTYAQESFFAVSHTTTHGYDIRQSFHSVNQTQDQFVIYVADFEFIYAHGFDSDLQTLGRLTCPIPLKTYGTTLVQSSFGETHTVIVSNKNLRKIAYAEFDFKKRVTNFGELDIDFKKQDFLKAFTHNNEPIILSVDRKESKLHIYRILADYSFTHKEIDLSAFEFVNYKGRVTDPDKVISDMSFGLTGINLDQRSNYPISMGQAASKTKLYLDTDQLTFVLDNYYKYSQILKVNIVTGESSLTNIAKPELAKDSPEIRSNSFLKGEDLAQIVFHRDTAKIAITNIRSSEVLQNFTVVKGEDFPNLNEPLLLKNSDKDKRKEIESEVFFRKLRNNEKLGIVLNEIDGYNQLNYGIYVKQSATSSGGFGFVVGFSIVGGAFGGAIGFGFSEVINPNMVSFAVTANGTSAEAMGLYSETYQYVPEATVSQTIFDKILEYRRENKKGRPVVLFDFNGQTIFGAYFSKDNYIDMFTYPLD